MSSIRYLIPVLLILTLFLPSHSEAQSVIINEVMASNSFTLADEDGDYEDWIELHNIGTETVYLQGWFISDDYENPTRWVFPDVSIAPGEFLLIWASNKNRADPSGELHTNFAISSDGEEILLSNPEEEQVDHLPPTSIPTDVSIGRIPGEYEEWYFFDEPTPGFENNSVGYQDKLPPPEFTVTPGFYSEPFELSIIHQDPEATIHYTLDGSEPDENSPVFSEPITIQSRDGDENLLSTIPTNIYTQGVGQWREPRSEIQKATVVRTRAVRSGFIESQPVGGTYLINPEGAGRYSLPVVSVITDSAGFFSNDDGIYVAGRFGNEDNGAFGNYSQRGREWERSISFELFETDGSLALSQNAGARIHGGWTRRFPQKSLRMYARNDYGEQYFNYPLFPEKEDDRYKRFILRNSGNDWANTLFMDAAAQSLIRHFNVDTQEYRSAILFLNGEYWGIHNFRERYDKHYLERMYGAEEENIDLLTSRYTIKEGDNEHYIEFINFMESSDLSDPDMMEIAETYMDLDNFLDYYSAQVYYGNSDWPHNNIDFWRYRTDYNPNAPQGLDGRWRWLLYDVDRSLGFSTLANFDMVEFILAENSPVMNEPWPNLIFLNLMENQQFKYDFVNRILDHLNSAFTPERVSSVIDSLRAPLEPEIDEHISRWTYPSSRTGWNWNVSRMYTYADERPGYLRNHLSDHLETGDTITIGFENLDNINGTVLINTLPLIPETPGVRIDDGVWSGIYFEQIPVIATAKPDPGYVFSHWSGDVEGLSSSDLTSPEITFQTIGDRTLTPHFEEATPDESGEPQLLANWVFTNDLPNNTALHTVSPIFINPDITAEGVAPSLTYQAAVSPYPPEEGTAGIMDRVNDPTGLNYRAEWNDDIPFEESDMRGVRVRNPSLVDGEESSVTFELPTTGYIDPVFSIAVRRTGSGQRELIVEYSADDFGEWTQDGLEFTSFEMFEEFNLITVSFEDIEETYDNPLFRVRLRFGGDEEIRMGDSGNLRFNNISYTGVVREFTSGETVDELPTAHTLHQNYPNPFNPATNIMFELAHSTHVQIDVYDLLGRHVASLVDQHLEAGSHTTTFDASSLSSGVYIYKMQTETGEQFQRMTLIK